MRLILTTIFFTITSFIFASQITIEVRNAFDDSRYSEATILICNFFEKVKERIELDDQGTARIEFKRSVYFKIAPDNKSYFGGTYKFKKDEGGSHKIVYVYPQPSLEKKIYDSSGCGNFKDSSGDNDIKDNNEEVNVKEGEFPGGNKAMIRFLSETITYPHESLILGEQGKVYAEFIVDEEGLIQCPTIMRGVSKFIDAEALRVIRKMPNWDPATVDGQNVRARCRIPINFVLH